MTRAPLSISCILMAAAAAGCAKQEAPAPAPAPPEVYTAEVIQQDVPVYVEIVGQTSGSQDVEIRARVEGYLDSVAFTEGSFVRQGALLYQIDPKTLEATLARAKADVATVEAHLQKTINDVERLEPLAKEQAVSQRELDNALSARDAAGAQVDAALAEADRAELDLGYARITSPINGLVGTTEVRAGNLVGRGESTLLTTVSVIDPIFFRAGISEAEYLQVGRRVAEIRASRGGKELAIELILADGTTFDHSGRLQAVEREVDSTTGTLTVQFSFPNPERLLRPGQYGRARFVIEEKKGALLVPQRAVQELQNLHNVVVVGADDTVSFRSVTVGPRVDSLWVIEEGLQPGDMVVVEGLQRLRDGAKVSPKPVPPPAKGAEAAPGGE